MEKSNEQKGFFPFCSIHLSSRHYCKSTSIKMSTKTSSSTTNSVSSLLGPSYHKISSVTACLFVVGEITGAALLAMPESMQNMGWYLGPTLMILTCIASAYCGVILSKCWIILEASDPSLKQIKTRNPYALIGERSCGKAGFYACILSLVVTLFGSCVVQILVCSEMMQSLIPVQISFCQWIIIVGLCLLPLSFFGSPADFSPVAFFAMSSTAVAAVLIFISLVTHGVADAGAETLNTSQEAPAQSHPSTISVTSVMVGWMSVCYAFSGTSCMPTIQNDMKNKKSFRTAIMCAYVIMICIYLPVSVIGYYKAGSNVQANIIQNLQPSLLKKIIQILMTAHVLCAYLILLNPVNQNIENMIGLRHSLNIWRCISRSLVTILAMFTALSIPKFGKLLPIVGASTTLIQTFILPSIFYFFLVRQHECVSSGQKLLLLLLVVAGTAGCIFGTKSALSDLLAPDALTLPCYIAAADCGK
jgi:vesicular inhibitory amino acid transporter